MNKIQNDGDPWSPVDQSATSLEAVKPKEPEKVRGGDVTAHINLGTEEPSKEEKAAADKAASDDSDTEGDDTPAEEEKTAAEVEDSEKSLANALAALDAAKTGKKTKK